MAAQNRRQTGHKLALAALLACLAVPAVAQGVPLPSSRPSASQAQPATPAPVAKPSVPTRGQVGPAQQSPVSNPFAALLGKPSPQGALPRHHGGSTTAWTNNLLAVRRWTEILFQFVP